MRLLHSFSNGTESICWFEGNCWRCANDSDRQDPPVMPDKTWCPGQAAIITSMSDEPRVTKEIEEYLELSAGDNAYIDGPCKKWVGVDAFSDPRGWRGGPRT